MVTVPGRRPYVPDPMFHRDAAPRSATGAARGVVGGVGNNAPTGSKRRSVARDSANSGVGRHPNVAGGRSQGHCSLASGLDLPALSSRHLVRGSAPSALINGGTICEQKPELRLEAGGQFVGVYSLRP